MFSTASRSGRSRGHSFSDGYQDLQSVRGVWAGRSAGEGAERDDVSCLRRREEKAATAVRQVRKGVRAQEDQQEERRLRADARASPLAAPRSSPASDDLGAAPRAAPPCADPATGKAAWDPCPLPDKTGPDGRCVGCNAFATAKWGACKGYVELGALKPDVVLSTGPDPAACVVDPRPFRVPTATSRGCAAAQAPAATTVLTDPGAGWTEPSGAATAGAGSPSALSARPPKDRRNPRREVRSLPLQCPRYSTACAAARPLPTPRSKAETRSGRSAQGATPREEGARQRPRVQKRRRRVSTVPQAPERGGLFGRRRLSKQGLLSLHGQTGRLQRKGHANEEFAGKRAPSSRSTA